MQWVDKVANPDVTLGWFVCLSVTMVTGDLHYLWNRVYSQFAQLSDIESKFLGRLLVVSNGLLLIPSREERSHNFKRV